MNNTKPKNKYRLFSEARRFVKKLKLKNKEEWVVYTKTPEFPKDIHKNPTKYKHWSGWGNWLGFDEGDFFINRSFNDAREYVRTLGLKSRKEWRTYRKDPNFPKYIRKNPLEYDSWVSWADWLGYEEIVRRSFGQAREFVRSLGLKNQKEWNEYRKREDFPKDIFKSPYQYNEWISMADWLGSERRSFKEAREWVISLNLKTTTEWYEYIKREEFPDDVFKNPKHYKEFQGMTHWLGRKTDKVLPIKKVQEIIRPFNLKNPKEYLEWWNRNEKYCIMRGIPKYPHKVYSK